MTDPLHDLYTPVVPADPDPDFARRLRERLETALLAPRTTPRTEIPMTDTLTAPRQGDVRYLSLWTPDPERAARFYAAVLGWRLVEGPDHPQIDGLSISQGLYAASTPTTFACFAVDDVDAASERVRAAGGTATDPRDQPHGRITRCVDDQGWNFALTTPAGGTAPASAAVPAPPGGGVPGDTVYLTHETRDVERLKAFLHAVLGWDFVPGSVEQGWGLATATWPMTGLHGGGGDATPGTVPVYQVADVDTAVATIRERGGRAGDPVAAPYGRRADCVDDQGAAFYLMQM